MSNKDLYNKLVEIYEDSESNDYVKFTIKCSDPDDSIETDKSLKILESRRIVSSYSELSNRLGYNGFMNPRDQWLEI